ncbi:MAG: DUF2147 domain-containing protein [Desulfobacterales bacterium]|nr:DUF2147 domain-containing protein [Desulfobacterales bacterium]
MNRLYLTIILSITLTSLLTLPSLCRAVEGDDIIGEWITQEKDCRVEIFKKNERYHGSIAALKYPNYLPGEEEGPNGTPRLDSNNPDVSLRSRPMVGIELLSHFRFDNGKWVDGHIYDPKNGKTYKCNISISEDGKLHVRGYIGLSLLGRTTIWESAKTYLEKELNFLGLNNCSCQ